MITVRFFTGVTLKYPDAKFFQQLSNGSTQICSGTKEVPVVLAVVQGTSGAVIEIGDLGKMDHPALKKGKFWWYK